VAEPASGGDGQVPGGDDGPRRPELPGAVVVVLAWLAGSVPFSGLAARLLRGVDLRRHGTGTVSGTGLYRVAGFGPLAVAGSLDVAKGAVGPLLAGRHRPLVGVAATAAAVAGHNWSVFLGGSGGRGVSPALGASLVSAPEGTAVLAAGLALGRLARQTGLGTFVALVALFPVLARRRGAGGALSALALAGPVLAKRVAGDRPLRPGRRAAQVAARLVLDRDLAAGPAQA
jgi:glycerol-3-phosphate acyltransferase PlsY